MFLDNLMRNRKPQAAPFILTVKGVENVIQVLSRDPYPCIANLNLNKLAGMPTVVLELSRVDKKIEPPSLMA